MCSTIPASANPETMLSDLARLPSSPAPRSEGDKYNSTDAYRSNKYTHATTTYYNNGDRRRNCEIPEVVATGLTANTRPNATRYQNLTRQNPDLTEVMRPNPLHALCHAIKANLPAREHTCGIVTRETQCTEGAAGAGDDAASTSNCPVVVPSATLVLRCLNSTS
jgi:hypothetical protein